MLPTSACFHRCTSAAPFPRSRRAACSLTYNSSFEFSPLLFNSLLEQRLAAVPQRHKFGFVQAVPLCRCLIAAPIEGAMTLRHGSEEAVEKVEADAEVGIHEAVAVQAFVMNVVQLARFQKPSPQARNSGHPIVLDVHAVVQIAEHQNGPAEEREKREHLVSMRHMKQSHHAPAEQENNCRRDKPFEPDVANGEPLLRGVVVFVGAHGLPGAIDQEMMDQMAPAEGWDFVAVQKPVQPVAGEFRNYDGVHQSCKDSDECDMQAFVKHGCTPSGLLR